MVRMIMVMVWTHVMLMVINLIEFVMVNSWHLTIKKLAGIL